MAIWKQILIVLVLCGLGYAVWHERERISQMAGLSSGAEQAAPGQRGGRGGNRGGGARKVPVIVDSVTVVKEVDRIQAVGSGLANMSITVFPKTSGQIAEIDFKAGQAVKAGDILFKLDEVQAKLTVGLAEARLQDAQRTLKRNEELLPQRAVAEVTVDAARTAVETARLEVEQAKETLADLTIRAPFAGVLGIPQVDLGDRVSETTPVTSLDDRSSIIVEFDVPEIYLNKLQTGHPVTATNQGFRDRTFEGKVSEIDSRVNVDTRSVRLRATLPNPEDVLRSGMSFTVSLTIEGQDYPSIPQLALMWERGASYVWRVAQGVAERVDVSMIEREESRVLVEGPLKAGELLVIEGSQRLRPGTAVDFVDPAQTVPTTAAEGNASL